MTVQEKKPYQEKAAELKVEYEKAMETYNAQNEEVKDNSDKCYIICVVNLLCCLSILTLCIFAVIQESNDHQAEELCDEDA